MLVHVVKNQKKFFTKFVVAKNSVDTTLSIVDDMLQTRFTCTLLLPKSIS